MLAALALSACGARTPLDAPELLFDAQASGDAADVRDAPDAPPARRVCLPPGSGPLLAVDLQTAPVVTVADVLFVLDTTGSMQGEIDNIRQSLQNVLIPGLVQSIRDLRLGLVTFRDFPVAEYGELDDEPFTLERPMTDQWFAIQGALDPLRASGGNDNPEGQLEALYQIATGEGLRAPPRMNNGFYIPPAEGCPGLGIGYACLRPRSIPILMVLTDAPSHNGRAADGTTTNPYDNSFFPAQRPHTYAETIAALQPLHARVIGINSGDGITTTARPDLERIATDTGAIGADGRPLVFDISDTGAGLSVQVVNAVQRFTQEVPFDVSAIAIDLDGRAGARLVSAIVPSRADPPDHIARLDATTFYRVIPGTRLFFTVQLDPSRAVASARDQVFRLRVDFLADRRSIVGTQELDVLIPAAGTPCPSTP